MAGMATEETTHQQQALNESRREREFYRYFEPMKSWTAKGPLYCNLGNAASMEAHTPIPSPDPALTAFCQLGALRINTRRAMMVFFDTTHAYVLAEATRTLSLLDDSIQDRQDSIWLGHAKIPRGYSVCEHTTLHLQPPHDDREAEAGENSSVHIIQDLREDPKFCDQPFVTASPGARFYAGVPIRTARGINIGAYCLLDDESRKGLNESELQFMRHMAITVMNHLEMVRAKAQHERATRMVTGIGAFVDGATDLGRGENDENTSMLSSVSGNVSSRQQRSLRDGASMDARSISPSHLHATRKPSNGSFIEQDKRSSPGKVSAGSPWQSPPDESPTPVYGGQTPQSSGVSPATESKRASKRADDLRAELVSSNVRATFERAASVLRDAVELDGAIFLDASSSSYGGLVGDADRSNQTAQTSDTAASSTDEAKVDKERQQDRDSSTERKSNRSAGVLASSYCIKGDTAQQAEVGTQLHEKFLKKLLRRYPKGKIWNFSADGTFSSDDDGSRIDTSVPSAGHAQGLLTRKKDRKHSRIEDGKRLAQHFPGVRSLAIIGIWNQAIGRWHAASIVWTYNEFRFLTDDLDMPFLQAFSDVLMAEVHRIEAQKSDRAKVDFISSISHELRSPLHGILGSVETIQEQGTDDFTSSLVTQIEACGRTLLDIVNNLLDFSKINYYGKTTQKNLQNDTGARQNQLTSASQTSSLGSMMSLDTEVSLEVVTEEVIDTAFYSFCCSKEREAILDRKVAIILDMEHGKDVNWWCRIALGGWKRIIINLVSNALKYTTEGYIHVSLARQPGKKKRHNAILTVKDSGHGMSKAFLQDRLFSAFAQENSFTDGTGLGMNLVATIVRAIGGKIEVQSEQNVGTSVVVRVPLDEAAPHSRTVDNVDDHSELGLQEGITVAIPSISKDSMSRRTSLPPAQATAQAIVIGSIVKICAELGVRTVNLDRHDSPHVDILFYTEDRFPGLYELSSREANDRETREGESPPGAMPAKPLIILCDNAVRLRDFRATHFDLLASRHVELIRQPAGPKRISKAIRACLAAKADGISAPTGRDDFKGETAAQRNRVLDREETARATPISEVPPPLPQHVDFAPDTGLIEPPSQAVRRRSHPLAQQMSTDDPTSPPQQHPVNSAQSAARPSLARAESGLTLLLVDDNPINLQLLVTYANKHGHLHICAHNGQHAIDAYKAACNGVPLPPHLVAIQTTNDERVRAAPSKPRIILMDVNMPVCNGYEATRGIREFERSQGLPPSTVIALTGLGSASAQQEAYSSGVDLFLTKPVKLKELSKILEGVEKEG